MKVKTCSSCDKTGPLWESSPALCKDCAMRIKAKEAHVENYLSNVAISPWLEKTKQKYATATIKRKPVTTHKDEYKEFFESLTIPERCEECNQQLLAFNNFGRRACSAHILPKSKFKSVATNPDNILFLGAGLLGGCRCHDIHDSCVENRKSMRVYKIALTRLEGFKHLLTDKEIVMAEKYLGI